MKEASTLYEKDLFRGSINRAYYAMLYAVMALAIIKNQVVSKHSAMISFYDKEYVKTGIFPKRTSQIFHLAFDLRQSVDYGELFTVSKEDARAVIADSMEFVVGIKIFLKVG